MSQQCTAPLRLSLLQEAPGAGKPPGSIFFSQPSEATGVTAVLTMPHARWQGLEGAGAGAYSALLAAGYPSLPASWRDEVGIRLGAGGRLGAGRSLPPPARPLPLWNCAPAWLTTNPP